MKRFDAALTQLGANMREAIFGHAHTWDAGKQTTDPYHVNLRKKQTQAHMRRRRLMARIKQQAFC